MSENLCFRKLLTIFAKSSIMDIWQGPKYTFETNGVVYMSSSQNILEILSPGKCLLKESFFTKVSITYAFLSVFWKKST